MRIWRCRSAPWRAALVAPDHRPCAPPGAVAGDPAVLTLRAEVAEVDRMVHVAADPAIRPSFTAISSPQPLEHRMQAEWPQASGSPVTLTLLSMRGSMGGPFPRAESRHARRGHATEIEPVTHS